MAGYQPVLEDMIEEARQIIEGMYEGKGKWAIILRIGGSFTLLLFLCALLSGTNPWVLPKEYLNNKKT